MMIVSGILREGVSSLRAVRFLFSFLMSCGLRRAFCGAAAVDGTLLHGLGGCGPWSSRRCGIDLCFVNVRGGGVGGAVVEVDCEIPLEAFAAVAEILTYVYKANSENKGIERDSEDYT